MHEGHRKRLKHRFIQEGLESFDEHQVLELVLFYVIPRKDTNELAHKLIQKYGSLSAVFEADPVELAKTDGISQNSAVLLTLIPSLSRYYLKDKWGEKEIIDSSAKAGKYVVDLFAGRSYEVFYLICLDTKNRVIHTALVHEGTINQVPIYPRIIVETALRHKANSVILAHNHPGGSIEISKADEEATGKIKKALNSISIQVMDHIIAVGNSYVSFAEKDLI